MQTVLILTFVSSLLAGLVSVSFGLFVRGRRLKGWVASAVSVFAAVFSLLGLSHTADADARSAGFLSYIDQVRASEANIQDPSEWAKVREEFEAKERATAAGKVETAPKPTPEQLCMKDLVCLGDRQVVWAGYRCPPEIEKLAKYRPNWTDGWLHPKFSHYRWLDEVSGTITMIGDEVEFQNGFGAGVNMIYECDIDPAMEQVLAVRVREGRL